MNLKTLDAADENNITLQAEVFLCRRGGKLIIAVEERYETFDETMRPFMFLFNIHGAGMMDQIESKKC